MSLPKLYKHYKITPQKLKEILENYSIKEDLRFVKIVPEKWVEILSIETGIPKIDLKNYAPPKKEVTVPDKDSKTSENSDALKKIRNNFQPVESKSKTYFAYVKFVAPDKSHAFIRILSDLNTIHEEKFRDRTDNDYRITKNCDQLDFNQIILCKTNEKHHYAEIVSTYFHGYLKNNNENKYLRKNDFHLLNHKAPPFTVEGIYPNYELISRELYYTNRIITAKSIAIEIDYTNYINQFKKEVESLISNEVIDETTIEKIKLLNANFFDYDHLLKIQFDIDCKNESYFNQEVEFEKFVKKWSLLKLEWLTLSNFNNLTLFTTYFRYWYENQLPLDFWGDQLINACIQYEIKYLAEEQEKSLHQSLLTKHKNLATETLTIFYETPFLINSFDIYNALINITKDFLPTQLNTFQDRIDESLPDELKFQLWSKNKTNIFPKEYAISVFENVDEEIQIQIIGKIESKEIASLLQFVKPNNNDECQLKLLEASINTIDNIFNTICFDIETDTKTIYEIAWKENRIIYNYCNDDTNDGIEAFKKITLLNKNTFVGQNIVDFDCVELQKYGIEFEKELIWDTFLIEMLLSPDLKNFALKTKHNASADVELTLSLFYNQITRIITLSENELELLYQYLDNNLIQKINQLKENNLWNWISKDFINLQKLTFFRPQPINEEFVTNLNDLLKEKKDKKNVIIVPENFKKVFYNLENAAFFSTTNKKDFGIIDIHKVKKLPDSFNWIKVCLENYYNFHVNKNQIPYWGNIGTAIKIKIGDDLDVFSIVSFKEDFTPKNDTNTIVNCSEFYAIKENLILIDDIQVYIINKEQILLENKTCIKTVELSELINAKTNNQFWLKFTGGLSFVELNEKDCLNLGIDIPENFENFWIEKHSFSSFNVWGNFNFEKILDTFFKNECNFIDTIDKSTQNYNIFFPKIKVDANANEEFISFNPETNYRSRYWLFQKEIIFQIIETNTPTLLVVQNEKEVSSLELYFRHLEFYIPSNEATLARRMELLHNHKSSKKMMIVAITDFDRTIAANYIDSLNIIIESLKLFENFFLAKNTSIFNNNFDEDFKNNSESSIDDNEDIDNDNEQNIALEIKKPLFKDIFFHLKLQTPLINYLKNSAFKNDPENKLWILDPRVNDYNEISEKWNAKPRTIIIGNELDFEYQLSVIEMFINGPKPLKELPFDLERTKEILSDIFLDGKPWYKEQIPYLDDIIPAKTDLLITLPTGGGKSLLFQGPAILRSAFTNKLTIVITPLKALMQDQVKALWDKGFYGCVEYLNSDRGTDTRIIYRAMAGGEVSLLFVTPERFRSNGFKKALNVRLKTDGGLEYAVFDEAHCVSQWGHEFRPDYFNGAKEINNLKKMANEEFPLLLFSATVSKKIYEDFNTIFS